MGKSWGAPGNSGVGGAGKAKLYSLVPVAKGLTKYNPLRRLRERKFLVRRKGNFGFGGANFVKTTKKVFGSQNFRGFGKKVFQLKQKTLLFGV